MLFFQFLLMFHLSYQIESRFLSIPFSDDESNEPLVQQSTPSTTIKNQSSKFRFASLLTLTFRYIAQNFTFIILVLNALSSILDLYLCYSLVSVILSPLKTWFLLVAFYLRYKCSRLGLGDFNKFIDTTRLKTTRSSLNMPEMEQTVKSIVRKSTRK